MKTTDQQTHELVSTTVHVGTGTGSYTCSCGATGSRTRGYTGEDLHLKAATAHRAHARRKLSLDKPPARR